MNIAYDPLLIPRLVGASRVLNTAKKDWLMENYAGFNEPKKRQLFDILVLEQTRRAEFLKRRLGVQDWHIRQKKSLANQYFEEVDLEKEKAEIAALQIGLEAIYAEESKKQTA
jgi:hypothetical protein